MRARLTAASLLLIVSGCSLVLDPSRHMGGDGKLDGGADSGGPPPDGGTDATEPDSGPPPDGGSACMPLTRSTSCGGTGRASPMGWPGMPFAMTFSTMLSWGSVNDVQLAASGQKLYVGARILGPPDVIRVMQYQITTNGQLVEEGEVTVPFDAMIGSIRSFAIRVLPNGHFTIVLIGANRGGGLSDVDIRRWDGSTWTGARLSGGMYQTCGSAAIAGGRPFGDPRGVWRELTSPAVVASLPILTLDADAYETSTGGSEGIATACDSPATQIAASDGELILVEGANFGISLWDGTSPEMRVVPSSDRALLGTPMGRFAITYVNDDSYVLGWPVGSGVHVHYLSCGTCADSCCLTALGTTTTNAQRSIALATLPGYGVVMAGLEDDGSGAQPLVTILDENTGDVAQELVTIPPAAGDAIYGDIAVAAVEVSAAIDPATIVVAATRGTSVIDLMVLKRPEM